MTRPQENLGYDHKFFEIVFSFKIILVNNVNACFKIVCRKKKLECYFLTHGEFLHFGRLSFYFEVEFLQNETSVYCMPVRIKRDRDYHKQ